MSLHRRLVRPVRYLLPIALVASYPSGQPRWQIVALRVTVLAHHHRLVRSGRAAGRSGTCPLIHERPSIAARANFGSEGDFRAVCPTPAAPYRASAHRQPIASSLPMRELQRQTQRQANEVGVLLPRSPEDIQPMSSVAMPRPNIPIVKLIESRSPGNEVTVLVPRRIWGRR